MQRHEIEHVLRTRELLVSAELDLYPSLHPEKADLIDGAIGALSTFHDTLPSDWMQRAKLVYLGNITAICDRLFERETLLQRIAKLSVTAGAALVIADWAKRRATEAHP